jgi:hypothetical protein
MRSVFLLVVAVLFAAGCGYPGDPRVDGIRVGPAVDCPECDEPFPGGMCEPLCESVADVARSALDGQSPDEPRLISLSFHEEGCPPSATGKCLVKRSGALWVVVADYADGPQHAVAVYCGVGGCFAKPEYRSESNGVS